MQTSKNPQCAPKLFKLEWCIQLKITNSPHRYNHSFIWL